MIPTRAEMSMLVRRFGDTSFDVGELNGDELTIALVEDNKAEAALNAAVDKLYIAIAEQASAAPRARRMETKTDA